MKAKTEYIYRVALAKELLINREKGLPVTLNNDVSKGNEEIAKHKFNRDVVETSYEATLEKLRATKIELVLWKGKWKLSGGENNGHN